MKSKFKFYFIFGVIFFTIFSCTDFSEAETIEISQQDIQQLIIPKGFDFSTQQNVAITISDSKSNVNYDVYAYSSKKILLSVKTSTGEDGMPVNDSIFSNNPLNNLIFSGVPHKGTLTQTIVLPKYYDQVFVLRNENLKFSSATIKIVDKKANFDVSSFTKKVKNSRTSSTVVSDYLYGVNGSGALVQIDPLTGVQTFISNMPMGSITCAVDQTNKVLYSLGNSSPYPLMKYSIENNTWQTIGNTISAPRLDYKNGLLYVSSGDNLYTYNPTNGARINSWKIKGLHSTGGGDLAFASDGTLFLCTFSGLYRLQLASNNEYQSTRISASNLPFQPTSMTFDSNGELWLANNSNNSSLIVMDTQTGGWQYKYGVAANNNTSLGRSINDLTTFKVYSQVNTEVDTDNDGIVDRLDKYPQDSDKAFELYTPSRYGWGTLAFEDLWPYTGDYDFNDLALNYKAIAILNSQNLAVQLDFTIKVKSNGASFKNGFGLEFENLTPSQITSVTGNILNQNFIQQNSNGTEMNQTKAVVILFDNAQSVLNNEFTISIKFNQPITTSALGLAPFNPFVIINKERNKEIHLPNRNRTSLGANNINIPGVHNDKNGDYLTDNGLPWAINIVHDFKTPKEKVAVNKAYNYFNQWATSGGADFQDWYKDNPGNQNENQIKQ